MWISCNYGSRNFRVGAVTALANDYGDTPYQFSFDYGNTCQTETRWKDDTSAAFMNCQSCDGNDFGYTAYVFGSWDESKSGSVCCSDRRSIHAGNSYLLSNSVYQDRNYAYFYGELNANDAVGYSGLWSPDNYECYQ